VFIKTFVGIVSVTQYLQAVEAKKVIYEKWKTVKKHAALIVTAMSLRSSVRTTDSNLPFLSRSKQEIEVIRIR